MEALAGQQNSLRSAHYHSRTVLKSIFFNILGIYASYIRVAWHTLSLRCLSDGPSVTALAGRTTGAALIERTLWLGALKRCFTKFELLINYPSLERLRSDIILTNVRGAFVQIVRPALQSRLGRLAAAQIGISSTRWLIYRTANDKPSPLTPPASNNVGISNLKMLDHLDLRWFRFTALASR